MGSNTITPSPVLNSHASDDEILGLLTQPPRRLVRRETKSEGRDAGAQDLGARTNEQLDAEFADGDAEEQGTRRNSKNDARAADANVATESEPEHLREALDANPELREAWQQARRGELR